MYNIPVFMKNEIEKEEAVKMNGKKLPTAVIRGTKTDNHLLTVVLYFHEQKKSVCTFFTCSHLSARNQHPDVMWLWLSI